MSLPTALELAQRAPERAIGHIAYVDAPESGIDWPDALIKGLPGRQNPNHPERVKHEVMDAFRRHSHMTEGILDDCTSGVPRVMLRALAKGLVFNMAINAICGLTVPHLAKPGKDNPIGGQVVLKEQQRQLTRAGAQKADEIWQILAHGGVVRDNPHSGEPGAWDGHNQVKGDNLQAALTKLCRDFIELDQVFVAREGSPKIGRKRANPVMFWRAEDASLMRYVDSGVYAPRLRPELERAVKYVMLDPGGYVGGVIREYAWDEGLMAHRHPRTEFLAYGYGRSEVEQCLDAALGIAYTLQINKAQQSDNHIPAGFWKILGDMPAGTVEAFAMKLKQDVGLHRPFGTPILQMPAIPGADIQYQTLVDPRSRDMMFPQWMTFNVVVVSAILQIAPEEFGFRAFGGPTSVLSDTDPSAAIMNGRTRGILSRVLSLARVVSEGVVEPIDPDFEFACMGLESRYNPELIQQAQLDVARMQTGTSKNELERLRDDPQTYDPLDRALWHSIEKKHADKWYPSEVARREAVCDAYCDQGGKLGSWPGAPTGNPGALQIWTSEHVAPGQQAQQAMGQMLQQGQQEDGAPMEPGQGQQGQQPPAQAGEQAPAQDAGGTPELHPREANPFAKGIPCRVVVIEEE